MLRRADGVVAISEATRQDAIELLGLHPDRIATIYPGIPDAYFQPPPPKILNKVRERYGIRNKYILYVGTIEPRKNIDRILDAYEQLPDATREEYMLVLAGMEGWASRRTLARVRNPTSNIRYLGYVPEADMPALTAGAYLLVYPSLYEGFGLPVAQAMASGVPVITSGTGALREVAGEAALLVDPLSVDEIRTALSHLITSSSLHAELSLKSRVQAQKFHWRENATQMWAFFERVAGSSGRSRS